MKKLVILLLAFTLCLALVSCDLVNNFMHEHAYGEWETKTAATCTEAEVEVRKCSCGAEETRTGDAAVDHNMVSAYDNTHHWTACSYDCGTVTEKAAHVATSIKAVCNKTNYVQGDVALVADFTVTATCDCGASYEVSEGVVLENATLVSGANIVTVKLGEHSSNVQINADKKVVVIDGSIVADTYVFSDKQNDPFHERETMGTHSGSFRVYLKYDFSKILADTYFADNKDDAKIQFTFTIVEGAYTDETSFSFGGFIPGEGVSDVDFADITWNAVKETNLGWSNATQPMDQLVGSHHVSFTETTLTLTFTYAQVKDYIDANGIGIFTFRAKQSGVKISSMEGVSAPTVKAIVDDSHLHAFNQRIESEQYFISAYCEEPTYYYKSCRCGEHGDDFFKTETINEHVFGEWDVVTFATCTEDGSKIRRCTLCEDGVEEGIIDALKHDYTYVVTPPTCTAAGYTTYTCTRGDHTYTADETSEKGHTSNNIWVYNDSYHWTNCVDCNVEMNNDVHKGGTATEDEQAVCDTCKQPYGGLATHEHSYNADVTEPNCTTEGYTTYTCGCGHVYVADKVAATGHTYGAWESVSPATCDKDEVLIHYCNCGVSETTKGTGAFGHDVQTKYDENNHWTECVHYCGLSTEAVAHFGGTATETEQATCEGCGQKYGDLKPQQQVITGSIVQDTYITSNKGKVEGSDKEVSLKDVDLSKYESFGTKSDKNRSYFIFNLGNLGLTDEQAASAVVEFSFAIVSGSINNDTTFTFGSYTPDTCVIDSYNFLTENNSLSKITWSSTSTNTSGAYKALAYSASKKLVNAEKVGNAVTCENNVITITVSYNALKDYVDSNGNILVVLASNTDLKIASMENTSYAAPAVSVTYTK